MLPFLLSTLSTGPLVLPPYYSDTGEGNEKRHRRNLRCRILETFWPRFSPTTKL
jgi:hypothetical protein